MLIVVACIVCCVMAALVAVAYFVLTKPPPKQAPLLSTTMVKDLMEKYNNIASAPVQYSNILGYSIGHAGHVITPAIPPNTLNIQGCNNYCNGTSDCQGFQFNSITNTCEILSNVANTFYSFDQGWNLFVTGNVSNDGLGSKIQSQGFSADPSKKHGPIASATTYDACVPYCFSNASSCKGFSISSHGCTLFDDVSTQIIDASSDSWKVVPVIHGTGLSAPSPPV